jgi:hypothetical protein
MRTSLYNVYTGIMASIKKKPGAAIWSYYKAIHWKEKKPGRFRSKPVRSRGTGGEKGLTGSRQTSPIQVQLRKDLT